MRFSRLFDDLEAQMTSSEREKFRADVASRARSERADVTFADVLASAEGASVRVGIRGGTVIDGIVIEASRAWIVIEAAGTDVLTPASAIVWIQTATNAAAPPSRVWDAVGVGHALRALSRDRSRIIIATEAGDVSGLIAAVGADQCAVRKGDGSVVTIAFDAIRTVVSER